MRPHLTALTLLAALVAPLAGQGKQPVSDAKTLPPPTKSEWFADLHKRLEVGEGEDDVFAAFEFRNPRDEEIVWHDFGASCACSHLEFTVGDRQYWLKPKPRELVQLVAGADGGAPQRVPVESIPVHPGETGHVDVHVNLHGQPGKKAIQADIHSSDKAEPQTRLLFETHRIATVVVTPPEIDLDVVSPGEAREFAFEVHASGRKDFEITPPMQLPKGIELELEKVVNNGIAVWSIKGRYGPFQVGQGGAFELKFSTNIKAEPSFSLRVAGRVAQPIDVTPGFLPMGRIDPAVGKSREIRFHANDGTDLEAVKVEIANLNPSAAKVEHRVRKDGKDLIVEITVPKDAPKGLLRGDLVVELNHATEPAQRVLFNAFIR